MQLFAEKGDFSNKKRPKRDPKSGLGLLRDPVGSSAIGWVKETVKIEGEGSVDSTLQRLIPPRNSYMYVTCRMSRVMCSMINVKYIQ